MLYIFFKSFFRNVSKNRGTFLINLFGFTLGIAITILIFLFVLNEISFDKHHKKSDRIYRLAVQAMIGETRINQTSSSARVLKEMRERYPEIENAVKLLNAGSSTFKYNNTVYNEDQVVFSDSTFFEVFSTQIIDGEFNSPLSRPNTILLSESCAHKIFGEESAIGEEIEINNQFLGSNLFEVVGVFRDMPANSHFHFDHLVPNFTFPSIIDDTGWSTNIFRTYLLLEEGASARMLEEKFVDYVKSSMGRSEAEYEAWIAQGNFWKFFLQALPDIHLNSDLNGEWEANGNIKYVWIFAAIGIFVLIIACINFINLSIAKSTLRAREVGIKKAAGSTRIMLIRQFLGESILITFIGIILAFVLVMILLPYYSTWLERDFTFHLFSRWYIIPLFILIGFLLSIINGIYPALVLSSFKPVKVLKGEASTQSLGLGVRNILVIIQFAASIFLIISTLVVNKELKLLQGDDLGFSKNNVMIINTSPEIYPVIDSYKKELMKLSGVISVAASNTLPGYGFSNWGFGAEGVDQSFTLNVIAGDHDFLKTMNFEMVEGRYYQLDHPSDSTAAILNETAVKVLGIEDPIGLKINNYATVRQVYEVIGVIRDFHYESLHSEIRPMTLMLQGGAYQSNISYLTVKYADGNETELLNRAEELWNGMVPGVPFIHSYLEEEYNNLYSNEEQSRQVFSIMALLSIIVACLGLYGLASFISQQRSREVALRKVFGSSISQVIRLLLSKYSVWVTISFLIASPLAFWVMSNWLKNFAFKVTIAPLIFIVSLIIALLMAIVTIGSNTNKTARANPADTLRHQ